MAGAQHVSDRGERWKRAGEDRSRSTAQRRDGERRHSRSFPLARRAIRAIAGRLESAYEYNKVQFKYTLNAPERSSNSALKNVRPRSQGRRQSSACVSPLNMILYSHFIYGHKEIS